MFLNKITSVFKTNFGSFIEPLKKIAQDLGQISAYVKDPNKSALALLEKRVDLPQGLPCDDDKKREIIGDIVFAEKQQRALGRLIESDQAGIRKLETQIKPTKDKIKSLDEESKKIRKKMTSPWSSLWERGKSALKAARRTPKDIVDLILSTGTARESKLFVEMRRNQAKQEKIGDTISSEQQKINAYKGDISFLESQKAQFADKASEFKLAGEECGKDFSQ